MLSKELISEIKKRLLSKFDIEKIILFGSQARGSANRYSDVDLLIIINNIKNRLKLIDKVDKYFVEKTKDVGNKQMQYRELEIEVTAVQQGGYKFRF